MTNAQTGTLVLKDATGSYFRVSQETLEQGRVPEDQKAEVERLIAESDDVQGHVLPLIAFAVGFGMGYTAVRAREEVVDKATAAHIYQTAAAGGKPA